MASDGDPSAEGAGWHEPSHLGGDGSGDGADHHWEPPGWSLPPAERQGAPRAAGPRRRPPPPPPGRQVPPGQAPPRPADPRPADPRPADPDVEGQAPDEPGYGVDPRAV